MNATSSRLSVQMIAVLARYIAIGITLFVLCGALYFAAFMLMGESVFPLDPGIDTVFAPQYSETGFEQIQIGDSQERVLDLIGEPLERGKLIQGQEQWVYSQDGGFCCFDFAWLWRSVTFDQNRVRNKSAETYDD